MTNYPDFGDLSSYVLPIEQDGADCPSDLFPLILLLRMLLEGQVDGVFYKTAWQVDDGDTHYTDIFAYDAGSEYHKGSLKKIATARFDTAVRVDSIGSGTIRGLYIATDMSGTSADCCDAVLTLLRMAALGKPSGTLVIENVSEDSVSIQVRQYKDGEEKTIDIGTLHWLTVNTRCSRFYGNYGDCVFKLV